MSAGYLHVPRRTFPGSDDSNVLTQIPLRVYGLPNGDVIQLCRRQESPATCYSDTRWHEDLRA
ncbi:hypothetical protein [Escherichia coli]|uniref:hypothetical protein n=1 Tax=Escherichia coli TaxID=562 RepID=UPI0035B62D8F